MADPVLAEVLAEAADAEALAEDMCGGPEILVVVEPPAEPPPPAVKRPRCRRPVETCPGRDGTPCIFSLQPRTLGQAARCRHGEAACAWCSPASLTEQLQNPHSRRQLTRALRIWSEADESAVLAAAWQRLPEVYHDTLTAALARPSRAKAAVAARKAAAAEAQSWHALLAHRVNPGLPVSADADTVYRSKKADDERRLRAKFRPWVAARAEGDESWRSALATRFEAWCREGSWAMCQKCHRLERRPVWQRDITTTESSRSSRHTIARCQHCRAGTGYPTVMPDFIPAQLRNLSLNALWALRPLSPHVGLPVFARHGYRVHTDMIRFWWRPHSVESQIAMLTDADRVAATAAYDYLMGADDSSYSRFVHMHHQFLRRYRSDLSGDERDGRLRLPRRALEEVGLECAVWPHLYPRTTMCETHIRKADVRRRDRPAGQGSSILDNIMFDADDAISADEGMRDFHEQEEEWSEADEVEAVAPLDFARSGRNSAKSAYLAKVLGPTLGYGADYELFQFVYDLWLWSALGAKKNTVEAPLRVAMSGYSFSPEYWQTRHAALIDVVKQLGLPTLFVTVAPYEWSFPFHSWVEDEMAKLLRGRLRLPVAETLHIAHVLGQAVQGLLTGANKQTTSGEDKAGWRSHIFAAKDGSGRKTVVNFFGRLEYQDGKRRRYVNQQEVASQFYHGRGTVHLHLLIWLQHVEAVRLEDSLSATVPDDNPVMASLVEGSQRSWTGSGWPLHPGASHYDASDGVLRLQHKESDFCTYNDATGDPEGVRGYIKDLLASLHCHIDVQMSDGRGMLLRYVSGYVPKFSDSFTTEWLADACSDYAVARRVLTDYHPMEPEMTLQLAMQWFPQCFAGSTLQRFPVPVPWENELPERVQQYLASPRRAADMPLADFLRRTNQKGSIHQAFRKRYKDTAGVHGDVEPLEVWVNSAPLCGDVAVAAIYLSRYSDRYYGQWVLMNVPFRSLDELHRPELDLVPSHLYYQTLAFLLRPQHWTSEEAIRAELELEAFREHHVRNIVAMIFANQVLIRRYLSGELDKNEDVPSLDAATQSCGRSAGVQLSGQQRRIADEIVDSAQQGMQRRQQREDSWRGEGWDSPDPADAAAANPAWAADTSPFAGVVDARTPFAVLGPAGSGKTTAVHDAIQRVSAAGGRILLTAPTGRLAATLRERFPDLEVDTVHGAFLVHKPAQEALEVLWPYDLIVVEEVGQLSRTIFERILEQWQATERIPTLVFVGDFYQLPGVDPTSALDSPHWHSVLIKKRELRTMQRCKCPKLRKVLELLRIGKPSVQQLREITAGHKAPSLRRRGYVMNAEPSMEDVAHILEETPNTLFLTISRRACAQLNEAAVASLFAEDIPLAVVPGDPESNVENFARGRMVTGDTDARGRAHLRRLASHPHQELEQVRRVRERHGRSGVGHGPRQHHREDGPRSQAGRASLDLRGPHVSLPAAAWLRKHLAQGAGCDPSERHPLAGRAQHARRGLCRPQPRRVRRELALRGEPRHSSLLAGTPSLRRLRH